MSAKHTMQILILFAYHLQCWDDNDDDYDDDDNDDDDYDVDIMMT